MGFKEELKIDVEALDVEWLRQPGLFMKWSEELTEAIAHRDLAKDQLEILEAELAGDIRQNPKKYGLDKVTESAIVEAMKRDEAWKSKKKELREANREVNLLAGAVKAFDHRKRALENLVTLHGQKYFAGPKVPRSFSDIQDALAEQAREVNRKMRNRVRGKRE